ncbi:MAG: hypothetical protein AB7G75_16800 [Candidatus Binatia bacterium]
MKLTPLFLALIFLLWPMAMPAQITPEPPPLVRFTGSFLPVSEGQNSTLSTLTVSIKGKRWWFRIAKIEKLTGRHSSGTRLLQSLFPRFLHLTGPEHLLNTLQDPQIEGQPLTLEGRLYVGEHMLFVTLIDTQSQQQK